MLKDGETVLCAVSGGVDSVCLLHFLKNRGKNDIVCAHYNHALRARESDRDELFVKNLCIELKIKFITERGDVLAHAKKNRLGIEEAARALRYDFLQRAAKNAGAQKIATAHNAQDNAETLLMNLARGAALCGASAISPVRENIIRPLLTATRQELEEYLRQNALPHVEDSTNASDAFARNRIRHKVLPVLAQNNSAAVPNISNSIMAMREDEEFLQSLAHSFLKDNLQAGAISAEKLKSAPRPIACRAIKLLCHSAQRVHLEAVLDLCDSRAHASLNLPGIKVTREQEKIFFGTAQEIKAFAKCAVIPGQKTEIPELGITVVCEKTKKIEIINNSFNTFFFNCENIYGTISVAPRNPGDKIELLGRGCTKTIKKLFSEAKLPLAAREQTPVFYDDCGPIAVAGFGVAARAAANSKTEKIIKIEIIQNG